MMAMQPDVEQTIGRIAPPASLMATKVDPMDALSVKSLTSEYACYLQALGKLRVHLYISM